MPLRVWGKAAYSHERAEGLPALTGPSSVFGLTVTATPDATEYQVLDVSVVGICCTALFMASQGVCVVSSASLSTRQL